MGRSGFYKGGSVFLVKGKMSKGFKIEKDFLYLSNKKKIWIVGLLRIKWRKM